MKVKVAQLCPILCDPMNQMVWSVEFSRPEYWSAQPFPYPEYHPNPEIKPRSPALQGDSLPAEPPEKPKNTGVGSLPLHQGIIPTQGSNTGLPNCREILYQLSHQGNPRILEWVAYPFSRDLPNPGIQAGSPPLHADSLPAELPGKDDMSKYKECPQERVSHLLNTEFVLNYRSILKPCYVITEIRSK